MNTKPLRTAVAWLVLMGGVALAQNQEQTVVPRLVQFSGAVTDSSGKAATGSATLTFSLYEAQQGGTPLWSETQTLTLDSQGHYTALVGSASASGMPLDLFASGAARWLGVQPQLPGVGEQPRVLLVGVPYALKAADADTLGGKPASAFVTTDAAVSGSAELLSNSAASRSATGKAADLQNKSALPSLPGEKNGKALNPTSVTGSGTTNFVPLWTGSSTLGNSALFQSSGKVGIGTTAPTQLFQVNGSSGILSSGAGAGLYFQMRDSTTQSAWYGAGNVSRFWRSDQNGGKGGDVIGITSAGNVGIGTDSPSNVLQVNGSSEILSTGSGAGFKFGMRDGGTTTSVWYGTGNVSRFWRSDKGDIIGVNSAGQVGIGTDSPTQALQVNGEMYSTGSVGGYLFGMRDGGTVSSAWYGTGNVSRFWRSDKGDIIGVNSAGQVGIGTTTPAATLEVNGTSKFDQAVTFAAGQVFPGAGTVTSVTAGTDLTGGGTSGTVTLNLDTTKVPQLNTANVFSASDANTFLLQGINTATGGGGFFTEGDVEGIVSEATSTSAASFGVQGSSSSSSAFSAGVFGGSFMSSGETFGVEGISSSTAGVGVQGAGFNASTEGSSLTGFSPFGVWGDSSNSGTLGAGVLGSADDEAAGEFFNNSPSSFATVLAENDETTSSSNTVFETFGGFFSGFCLIDVSGNLSCSGSVSTPVKRSDGRKVALYSMQSPENWFEDFGSGQLASGVASIALDPGFADTISASADYHVFLTPNGDCEGLYVANKTAGGFEVRELRGGHASVSFDYRIVAHRKGYENVRMEDVTAKVRPPQIKRRTGAAPKRVMPPLPHPAALGPVAQKR